MSVTRRALPTTPRAALAIGFAALAVAATVAGAALNLEAGAGQAAGSLADLPPKPEEMFVLDIAVVVLDVLAIATVGALIAIRVPGNNIGWLLLIAAIGLGVYELSDGYETLSRAVAGGRWPGTAVAAWLGSYFGPVLYVLWAIPLIYPDGRLLSRRWRWLVGLIVLAAATNSLLRLRPGLLPFTPIENPFGVAGIEPFLDVLDSPPLVAGQLIIFGGVIASVVLRFRRGTAAERAQLKWLIAATFVALIPTPIGLVARSLGLTALFWICWYAYLLSLAALPVAIGIAVLRYRLYEIDRIVSRTIGWTLVTGVLGAVFAGMVVGLQAILTGITQGQTLAVATSTLVAFVLFQPVRRRIQAVVDRRFNRASYNAERTAAVFAERLRDQVNLAGLKVDIAGTVDSAFRPRAVGVWIRPSERGGTP
jgi:hypothetical protein